MNMPGWSARIVDARGRRVAQLDPDEAHALRETSVRHDVATDV
jgi:hypothetical protein